MGLLKRLFGTTSAPEKTEAEQQVNRFSALIGNYFGKEISTTVAVQAVKLAAEIGESARGLSGAEALILKDMLKQGGFKTHENEGQETLTGYNDDAFGRFIVGQALISLEKGDAPYPTITGPQADLYFARVGQAAPGEQAKPKKLEIR